MIIIVYTHFIKSQVFVTITTIIIWFYRGIKRVFMIMVNHWFIWEILRFVSDSFFFLFHSLTVFFLSVEAVRELRME